MKAMKKIILVLLSSLMALDLYASGEVLNWADLELYERYELSSLVELSPEIVIAAKEQFELTDIITGGVPVVYLEFHKINCTDVEQTSEMVLINPDPNDNNRDHSVGVELKEGCNLGVFVEPADLYSKSLFLNLSTH